MSEVQVKFQTQAEDMTGRPCAYYMVGAINKAGFKRVARMIPESELARVKAEFQVFAAGSELPAAHIRF